MPQVSTAVPYTLTRLGVVMAPDPDFRDRAAAAAHRSGRRGSVRRVPRCRRPRPAGHPIPGGSVLDRVRPGWTVASPRASHQPPSVPTEESAMKRRSVLLGSSLVLTTPLLASAPAAAATQATRPVAAGYLPAGALTNLAHLDFLRDRVSPPAQ